MQVGAEFSGCGFSFHGSNHFAANDKTADIRATRFFNILLHQNIGLQTHKGFDDAFRRFLGFGQYNADTLRAFEKFYNERRAAYHFNDVFNIVRLTGESGHRQSDPFAGKQLERAQFVARAGDGD